MQCPQCSAPLESMEYEGALIHACNGCGGELLGGEALAHIVRERQEQFTPELRKALAERKPSFGIPEAQTERQLECPSCCTPMTVTNYGGNSGVFVDRCSGCGSLWLDQQELERIQVLMERWADEAPQELAKIAGKLQAARRRAEEMSSKGFEGSRFAFVNALINRLLDAA